MSWWDSLEPRTRTRAVKWARAMQLSGLQYRVTSTRRSPRQEEAVTGRRDVLSAHAGGAAFDAVTSDPFAAGRLWLGLGGRWSPRDPEHFE